MTFQPLIPATGIVGLRLLTATQDTQRAVFDAQPALARDVAYFEEKIGSITSAEELVSDRRLLRVALGAFGLDEEVDKRALLRRVLEEGSEDPQSFANRLVDPRYNRFAAAFGFGDVLESRTGEVGFGTEITAAYKERQFELSVGQQDETLRLALNFRREIQTYAASSDPEGAAWFQVMGDQPVRRVVEEAFGLPVQFGQLDIDRQREDLKDISSKLLGSRSVAVFQDPQVVEDVLNRFLARRAAEEGPSSTTPGFSALTVLRGGVGAVGLANLVAARST